MLAGDFPHRLRENHHAVYEYTPMPPISWPELSDEIWCHRYYLRNLCDEDRFREWVIVDHIPLLQVGARCCRIDAAALLKATLPFDSHDVANLRDHTSKCTLHCQHVNNTWRQNRMPAILAPTMHATLTHASAVMKPQQSPRQLPALAASLKPQQNHHQLFALAAPLAGPFGPMARRARPQAPSHERIRRMRSSRHHTRPQRHGLRRGDEASLQAAGQEAPPGQEPRPSQQGQVFADPEGL